MKIDRLKGSSKDSRHWKWIDLDYTTDLFPDIVTPAEQAKPKRDPSGPGVWSAWTSDMDVIGPLLKDSATGRQLGKVVVEVKTPISAWSATLYHTSIQFANLSQGHGEPIPQLQLTLDYKKLEFTEVIKLTK